MEDWFAIFMHESTNTILVYRCLKLEDAKEKLDSLIESYERYPNENKKKKDFNGNSFEVHYDNKRFIRYSICGINEL